MSKTLKSLLRRIGLYLMPAVDGDPGPEGGEDGGDAPDDDQIDLDLSGDGPDDQGDTPPGDPPARSRTNVADLERRASEAERIARETHERLEALTRAGPQPSAEEQDEDRRLRDPNTSELEKWQINANRTLRQQTQATQRALQMAHDATDRANFQAKAASSPAYKKYETQVEAELQMARAAGQNPPREMILQLLVGRDMLAGKFKKAPANSGVPRNKPAAARSDVPRTGTGATDRQKRIARLENQII